MAHEIPEGLPLPEPALPESARKPDLWAGLLADALTRFATLVSPEEARAMLPEEAPDESWALAIAAARLHIAAADAGASGWSYDLAA